MAPVAATASSVTQVQEGLVLVDDLHLNSFTESEISTLISMVANRGYDVEVIDISSTVEGQTRLQMLEQRLRRATSFAVMLPRASYSEEEIDLVAAVR